MSKIEDHMSVVDAIEYFIDFIQSTHEKSLLTSLIFNKSSYHKITWIPFDYNWIIMKDMGVVCDALVKLGQIKLVIKHWNALIKSVEAARVIMFIDTTFDNLHKYLVIYGCKNSPKHKYINNYCLNKEVVIKIAEEIKSKLLK